MLVILPTGCKGGMGMMEKGIELLVGSEKCGEEGKRGVK
jgi:hypothetical protein